MAASSASTTSALAAPGAADFETLLFVPALLAALMPVAVEGALPPAIVDAGGGLRVKISLGAHSRYKGT